MTLSTLVFILAAADSTDTDIFSILEEDNTVSVGSRVEQKISEAASSVWVIDRDMIRLSAATNVADLLRLIPGFSILEWSNNESNVAVRTLGGTNESQVLMLVDNRNVTGVDGEIELGLLPVAISDIERIEVILGPASTLYGANAFSGVINIVTRRAVESGWRVYGQGQGGASWQSIGGHTPTLGAPHPVGDGFLEYSQAMHTEHTGDFALRVSFGGTFLSTATQVDPTNNSYQYAEPPDAQKGVANIDADWSLGHWRARLQIAGVISQAETYEEGSESIFHYWQGSANAEINGKDLGLKGDQLTLQLWYRNLSQNGISILPSVETDDVTLSENSGELLAFYALPTLYWNRLTVGTQIRLVDQDFVNDGISALVPQGHFQQLYGLFAEDQFRPLNWLILTGGIRVDAQQTSAWAPLARVVPSPRVALVLLPRPEHSFRLEYASAFRNPSLVDQFVTDKILNGEVTAAIPNPAILAEQHQLASFGYQGRVGYFRARAEAFYGYYSNIITQVQVDPPAELPVQFVNHGKSDEYGASGYVDVTPTKFFRAFAHYTYAESRNLSIPASAGRVYDSSPRHIAAIGGWLTLGRVEGGVQGYFNSDYHNPSSGALLPARFILNATCGVWVDNHRRVQIFAQGTNLTDTRVGSVWGKDFDDPSIMRVGPRVWLGVRLNLGSSPLL